MHAALPLEEMIIGTCLLLLFASILLTLANKIHIPFTILLVLFGVGLSWLGTRFPDILGPVHQLRISPDIILFLLLPTLIFESAYSLNGRLLAKNLGPVLMLAIPGVLVSTFIIGAILTLATPLPIVPALLLGAILSATDPVSVIALFKQLGAPARLTMLVEGESLLNDASSIVVARILMGLIVAGSITFQSVGKGAVDLVVIFAAGWVLGMCVAWVFGKTKLDSFVQITITTILAYGSYIFAEKVLHASGIMATMAAGLAMGGWGKEKVTPSIQEYLEHFWGYMAFVANALLFLLVGMRVNLGELSGAVGSLVWVYIAMLVSRALVVYGLIPLVSRKEKVDLRYQTIIFWGGLRGGIAIALALSLPAFEHTENFLALVMGAVLCTLVFHGLTIEPLLKFFKLDVPPLADRFTGIQGRLSALKHAARHMTDLVSGGLFSGSLTEKMRKESETEIARLHLDLTSLRKTEIGPGDECSMLFLAAFAEEKALFIDMLHKGHITEPTFREHSQLLTLNTDAVRYNRELEGNAQVTFQKKRRGRLARIVVKVPLLSRYAEQMRMQGISTDYEKTWARYKSTSQVLGHLDHLADLNAISDNVVENVRHRYLQWNEAAKKELDEVAGLFPEFVVDMQERFGRRLLLIAEAESIEQQQVQGLMPKGIAEKIKESIEHRLDSLKGQSVQKLVIDPSELLRKVPFFRDIPQAEFTAISAHMRPYSAPENETIIRQGAPGDSLFLIARGVVRISHKDKDGERDIASLVAGDFFGEMALLLHEPRNATARAITPSALYELKRADLDTVCAAYPVIHEALKTVSDRRKIEIDKAQAASDGETR